MTYQTAFVDKNGKLQLRNDVYGRDKALLAILKSDERKIADTPIERKDNTVRQEALAVPDVWAEYLRTALRIYHRTARSGSPSARAWRQEKSPANAIL